MFVFVLRHADRASNGSDALSPAGMARAERLAGMLVDSGVSHAFRSDAARTGATLEPLKAKLSGALAIATVATSGPGGIDAHIDTIVTAVGALPANAVAVVVGHSNTVGPIILGLGGGDIGVIGEDEFDKLFILCSSPAGTKSKLLLLRY